MHKAKTESWCKLQIWGDCNVVGEGPLTHECATLVGDVDNGGAVCVGSEVQGQGAIYRLLSFAVNLKLL